MPLAPPLWARRNQDGMPHVTALIRAPNSQSDISATLYRESALERPSVEITPLQAALRYKWFILGFAAVVTALVTFLIQQLPVTYTASASLMVDARKLRVTDGASVLSDPTLNIEQLHTVMEQLHSPRVAEDVIQQLNLRQNPLFCAKTTFSERLQASIGRLIGKPAPAAPATCDMSMTDATDKLLGAVSASNDGKSWIIRVSADASTPDLSTQIANAYAQAFVFEQRRQVSETTDQASAWLTNYLRTLRDQVQQADAAVEAFQQKNQLTPLRQGETVITQRLADLNAQLGEVTGQLSEKQAALHQAQSSGSSISAASPAVLASPVIQGLIAKQADLQAQQAELSARFGDNYPSVQAANGQLARLRQAIRTEVGKVSAGLNEEVNALTARKAQLTTEVQSLQSTSGVQGGANVRLLSLQREAESERKLYESLETRLHEVDAEQHMQWPASSVVVAARNPLAPSFPRLKMMVTGVFLVSLGIGSGIAFALAMAARTFRDVDQVEGETGVRVLGLFPQPPRRATAGEMVNTRPGSLEAETVHYTLANLIRGRDTMRPSSSGWVVMVSSALPGEGKSSLAAALGQAAVRLGMSAALLEGDVRAEAPRGRRAARGEPEIVAPLTAGEQMPGQAISKVVDRSFLHVLSLRSLIPGVRRLTGSSEVATIIRNLQAQYEIVIVDTPPLLAVPDALTMAPLVDDTILVVDWRKTPRRSVMATVKVLMRANMEITGIVLSKVNLRQFARQRTSEGLYARGYKGHSVAVAD